MEWSFVMLMLIIVKEVCTRLTLKNKSSLAVLSSTLGSRYALQSFWVGSMTEKGNIT